MHLLNYDLFDLHALIVVLRAFPDRTELIPALKEITSYIKKESDENNIHDNTVRRILLPYISENDEHLSWVHVMNAYTANIRIIKQKAYYDVLCAVFEELILSLSESSEKTYLAADACHNIPLLLADVKNPRKAVESMIKDYRKIYSHDFLKNELKNVR